MGSPPRGPVGRHEILSRVQTILRRLRLAPDGELLGEDVGLLGQGIGLDSIEILRVVAAVEDEFDLTIDDQSLKPEFFVTVGTLVAFIQERTT
ncbi:MAG: acyl carrier protein [Burkholderiales bacterium]